MTQRSVLWAVAALLGIVLTAVLTWSVSRLAGQRIGLSAAPIAVIRGLAPSPPRRAPDEHSEPRTSSSILHRRRPPRVRTEGSAATRPLFVPTVTTPAAGPVTTITPTASTPTRHTATSSRSDDSGDGGGASSNSNSTRTGSHGGGSHRDD